MVNVNVEIVLSSENPTVQKSGKSRKGEWNRRTSNKNRRGTEKSEGWQRETKKTPPQATNKLKEAMRGPAHGHPGPVVSDTVGAAAPHITHRKP